METTNGVDKVVTKKNGFHKGPMELYLVRISPACRAVWLYVIQNEIPHLLIDVDFSKGPKQLPPVFRNQPHQEVPLLMDGEIIVFEAQAILRYLSMKYTASAGFGLSLQTQMLCESVISWSFGELLRSVGYLYVFPQFLEGYSFSPESANEVVVEKGLRQVTTHLEILENNYLEKSRYLTGSKVTVADTCAASVLVLLEWTGFSFKMWPKVDSWLTRVKQQMFWDEVHTTHNDFVAELERANLVQR
uniref:Glutathione S-transferase theta-1-like n=1 Tax=Crassostrea virginica TaxID=6565 RepID=A0A8B8ET09_CRAVI|nr:glutathione S-transferase theta-1-like [Crassostrea virginica]